MDNMSRDYLAVVVMYLLSRYDFIIKAGVIASIIAIVFVASNVSYSLYRNAREEVAIFRLNRAEKKIASTKCHLYVVK